MNQMYIYTNAINSVICVLYVSVNLMLMIYHSKPYMCDILTCPEEARVGRSPLKAQFTG